MQQYIFYSYQFKTIFNTKNIGMEYEDVPGDLILLFCFHRNFRNSTVATEFNSSLIYIG